MSRPILQALPNILSISRIALAAGFVATESSGVRLGLLGIAGLTDMLDGFLARRVNAMTRWGALIDPVADRFFALAAIAALLFDGLLTVPQYFVLIMRDLATAVGFLVARALPMLRTVTFKARWGGKGVTVLQFLALATALVYRQALGPVLAILFVASVLSIGDYTLALWRARRA